MAIVTIDGIPVYQALVDDEKTGMLRISLVDDPAVQSDFIAFAGNKRPQMYAVQDEEKRLVLGVVMRADFPIYRRDESGEYYIIYKADTIRAMAEKYLVEGRQNEVNLMHVSGSEVDGVHMVQYFIKGGGISPVGFEDISDGSLFAEFHVENDDVWEEIKAGTYKGFSLEGFFNLVPETDKPFVEQVVDALDGVFSRIFKHQPNQYEKMKKKGLLARLAKALVELGNVTTDKGVLAWDGDEDLKAGDAVFIEDADGNRTAAEDGDYTTEDGKVIVVADGKVTEIRDREAQVAPTEGPENVEAREVVTDGGTLIWDGEEDLKAGDEVFVADEEGNRSAAPDGDYKTEDGKVIVVVDGKVAEIKDDEAQVAPENVEAKMKRIIAAFSESYEEKYRKIYEAIVALGFDPYGYIVEAGDDFAVYETWGESGAKYTRFTVKWDADGNAVVENPEEVVSAFVTKEEKEAAEARDTEVETLRRENADLKARIEKKPAGVRAHEEASLAAIKTGVNGFDRIAKLMSAK